MLINQNPILVTDAYKQTHHLQYPEGTRSCLLTSVSSTVMVSMRP